MRGCAISLVDDGSLDRDLRVSAMVRLGVGAASISNGVREEDSGQVSAVSESVTVSIRQCPLERVTTVENCMAFECEGR